VFHMDVAYVAMVIHVYCKCLFKMFHIFQTYVASALSVAYVAVDIHIYYRHMF
jgi:hypothetical protein